MRQLSEVTTRFTESVIREMTRICDSVGGLNLSQGFPDFESPAGIKQAAITAIQDEWNQYPVTFGEPNLRAAIAKKALAYNGIECDPATDITVTCGATEAMIATLKALINPGDEIIIFEPFYENYGPDSILSGATPRYVTLRAPDWTFDPAELRAAFGKHTKAIIINTPNNPTGKIFNREELQAIADLCVEFDCYAITDEIYEHILYDGAEHISLASLPGMADRTITINSISKTYSVTGWRVGWAIAPGAVTQRIRKVHDFFTVGAPTPFQHAAAAALGFPQEYYSSLQSHYDEARRYIVKILQGSGFGCTPPQGAYYVIADVSSLMHDFGVNDDTEFSRKLIEVTGVATVPGSSFYSKPALGARQVRFCFCKKWETLLAVGSRFDQLLAKRPVA